MIKRMAVMLVLTGLVFGGIFGFQAFKSKMIRKYMSAGQPPQTVSTTKATFEQWQTQDRAVGTLRAVRGADLAPEVAGTVQAIHFQSGEQVKAGMPLVQLNAEADAAKLKSLEAAAALAESTYRRNTEQFKLKAVSQATLDADAAASKSANAQVEEQQALVAKKLLRAPFDGRAGIRAVDLGQYLSPGTKIVTLQSLDPVFVDFLVPQALLARYAAGQRVLVTTDSFPGKSFEGRVAALDAKVDPATRNVKVRATVRNPKHLLLPGMFATVETASGGPVQLLTLPQTAISFNPYGNTVFVLDERKSADGMTELVAQQKFVTTGATRGDQVAVVSGLSEGETVVTSGQIKLRSGAVVTINNDIKPSNQAAPRPKDE
ncbi:MAG: efflux transporter periplasmic adaptor subunit [Betaproteobacteria bacterium RIFCSPLOWO2_12_FULL_65_14]|nr:MAG: efflux transporter periplasmic adaptor subunit [Betaproteobacteria bacterium RIFCSPLOWO2_12_FULL_65_14]